MDWDKIKHYLEFLRTDNVVQQLQEWEINDLNSNPLFLGGFAVIVMITYFLGCKKTAGILSGIGGFALVVSLAIGEGTGTAGLAGSGIWILIGGGVVAAGLLVYMVFVKSE
ncbi:MAG: hypothetical protein KAU22_09540 [Desulfuromonadales bacterium]|nr:hypothetical protein [Desulfuromonadales bacterium]